MPGMARKTAFYRMRDGLPTPEILWQLEWEYKSATDTRLTENDLSRKKGDLVEGNGDMNGAGNPMGSATELDRAAALAALAWQVAMGADEAVSDTPIDRFAAVREKQAAAATAERREPATSPRAAAPQRPRQPERPPEAPLGAAEAAAAGQAAAAGCDTLEALRAALEAFDGCDSLKHAAENLVHFDGAEDADILLIGEAPGADEDRRGKPFVGKSGQLLDAMLATIGLDRARVHITNTVYWRPPGNRTPTDAEVAACKPFLMKQIELVKPKILVTMGNPATKSMLATTKGITRIRGTWHDFAHPAFDQPIPSMPTFHPAYLLRGPAQKRYAWRDLLALKARLREMGAS